MSRSHSASISPPCSPDSEEQAETITRKRKRDDARSIELDRRPFTIRPDASEPFAAPQVLTPICLIPRARLPLAYLDASVGSNRRFSARIRSLEVLEALGGLPSVLIAEDEREKRLYAIERAERRTYALCRLGQTVDQKDLELAAGVVPLQNEKPTKRHALQRVGKDQPWWSRAALDVSLSLDVNCGDKQLPELAMAGHAPFQVPHALEGETLPEIQSCGDKGHLEMPMAGPTSALDVFQELAKQYQDALYLSRTSLAYFTKGPLSRARAAFSTSADSGLQTIELASFIREAILTATTLDKKYKDAVGGVVKELSPLGLETPEQTTKPKKKRKWKAKRDKSGLFSGEKEYVEKWWRSQDDGGLGITASAETLDAALKRRIPRMRSRETYLQVILTLEALAIEAGMSSQLDTQALECSLAADSQDADLQHDESQAMEETKKPNSKKPQDLSALLDVLLERLCIWHSLDFRSPAKKVRDSNGDTSDELNSFCVEVVIPFYMSRCPQHAAAVNKKLGGPSAPTPVKRKATRSRRPGEPATRHAPEQRPRKPLSRVATDTLTQTQIKHPPALHRSATDSDLLQQQLKREISEVPSPLSSIPTVAATTKQPPHPRKRTSLMHSMSFNRREVDFSAMLQANEARTRKRADVDQKLQDAITTLRKPNRALAVKEVAESADLSFAEATAKGRTAATKAKVAVTSAVHVTATPGGGRSVKATPAAGRRLAAMGADHERSSGASYVPSSSARLLAPPPARGVDEPPASTFAVPQTGHRPRYSAPAHATGIEDTPSRGFAKYMPQGLAHHPGTAGVPPLATRHALQIQQTPVKPLRSLSLVPPVAEALVETSPNAVNTIACLPTSKVMDESMYDALGWEEDEYEPLT
ncbi:hypothetical protein LTR91_007875 [Friedmanniomyces endolithicus]|uniref:DNA replication regulator Sld3 C-terminal domain-containing protein n=2 Tax=Friedmanniomyces endolithicus TaxID=329885 RepID=A0AAN6KNF8_9PEZI|nr:hypothetical protein LTS09_012517 [Friedmanniomyces endolithicus]KAK0273844.1 hypothetical protein LTR35_011970 [Friedmanniomyces endolithicus]KAK0310999.1 hypothetical protein LTR82_014448 [Friedmanniomyces endolithicus]KAK0926146.1 hypothetical protein LTR57_004397 [Friedmanniomyces endolithicus]KAK0981754.1 hypothetical protein LTS01_011601 [Friedmanniomyces endolithicus]